MAAVELLEVSRTIKSAMGESAGQFRQAANAANENLSRIVKDIARNFASQRKDITDLHNTIAEGQYSSEQTNEKIDGLTRVFQESISIQTSMLGEMRSISRNIKILNDNTETMNRNLSSNLVGQGTSVLTSLTSGFSSVATAIGAAAVGGAVFSQTGGDTGGGGMSPAVPFSGPNKPILDTIKERESGGNYQAHAKTSSASGAYQFTNGTWQTMTRKFGIGNEYPTAASAPPQIQDKVADAYVSDILKRTGGDVSKVPLEWFTGNTRGIMSPEQRAANPGVTAESYQAAFMKALAKHGGPTAGTTAAATATPQSTTTTPDATRASPAPEAIPSATSPRMETIGKEGGHGPISGAAHGHEHGEKMETSAALPSGDIVALGKALQGMGIGVSEHPSFGGVHPDKHYPGSAHNDGVAIDINAPGGIVEAQDPIWGARFDQLAKQIQAAGYTVLWRTRGHDNHIHAQIGGKGIKGGQSVIGGQTTPSAAPTPTTPGSSQPAMATPSAAGVASTPAPTPSSAEPVSQAPMTQAMAPQMPAFPMGQIMGMMGGMLPMGLGGILGSVLPMIGSALQGLESSPLPFAELTPQPTVANRNIQRVKEAAIENDTLPDLLSPASTAQNIPESQPGTGRMSPSDSSGYAYNLPGDIGWPDWAAMIGGNHWEEMKHYKKNMWG